MSKLLPSGKYDWLAREELEHLNWHQLPDDDYYGFIVQCDLQYPSELREADNEYPLAVERLAIQVQMLSDAQFAISRHYAGTRAAKNFKLVPNLRKRKNYDTQYRKLKFYLDL